MNILLVSNDKELAGPARVRLFHEQHDTIADTLREMGFRGKIPKEGLEPLDPIVSGDYDTHYKIFAIEQALHRGGHRVNYVDIADMTRVEAEIRSGNYDKIFNYAEGLAWYPFNERETEIAKLAEKYGVPHTGSSPDVARVVFDKYLFAEALTRAGVRTPPAVRVVRGDQYKGDYPVFVKPPCAGSGVGIDENTATNSEKLDSIVNQLVTECFQPVIVQPLIANAREYTVALLPHEGDIVAFVPLRIFHGGSYGWKYKYGENATVTKYVLSANPDECDVMRKLAVEAYKALGMQGFARVDIMYNHDPHVIEINQPAGLARGRMEISNRNLSYREVIRDEDISDYPRAVLASVHDPRHKHFDFPPLRSFVDVIDAIAQAPKVRY